MTKFKNGDIVQNIGIYRDFGYVLTLFSSEGYTSSVNVQKFDILTIVNVSYGFFDYQIPSEQSSCSWFRERGVTVLYDGVLYEMSNKFLTDENFRKI